MKKFDILIVSGSLFLFFSFFFSCKKANQEDANSNDHTIQQKSMDLLKKKIEQDGRSFLMASNVKTESYAVDENVNRVSIRDLKDRKNAREMTTCDDGNGDPIFGFDESVLESCSAYYLCGSGYQVTSSWLITTPMPLTATGSKGRIRLKNSSGTITYTNTNITPVSLTALSQTNSNFPGDVVYRVTYTSAFIDQTTFQGAVNLENGALVATSCSQGPQAISS